MLSGTSETEAYHQKNAAARLDLALFLDLVPAAVMVRAVAVTQLRVGFGLPKIGREREPFGGYFPLNDTILPVVRHSRHLQTMLGVPLVIFRACHNVPTGLQPRRFHTSSECVNMSSACINDKIRPQFTWLFLSGAAPARGGLTGSVSVAIIELHEKRKDTVRDLPWEAVICLKRPAD